MGVAQGRADEPAPHTGGPLRRRSPPPLPENPANAMVMDDSEGGQGHTPTGDTLAMASLAQDPPEVPFPFARGQVYQWQADLGPEPFKEDVDGLSITPDAPGADLRLRHVDRSSSPIHGPLVKGRGYQLLPESRCVHRTPGSASRPHVFGIQFALPPP